MVVVVNYTYIHISVLYNIIIEHMIILVCKLLGVHIYLFVIYTLTPSIIIILTVITMDWEAS
jgi:hypothetical protein